MKQKKILGCFGLLLTTAGSAGLVYEFKNQVIGSGAHHVGDSTRQMRYVLGQPAIGSNDGGEFAISFGVIHPNRDLIFFNEFE